MSSIDRPYGYYHGMKTLVASAIVLALGVIALVVAIFNRDVARYVWLIAAITTLALVGVLAGRSFIRRYPPRHSDADRAVREFIRSRRR